MTFKFEIDEGVFIDVINATGDNSPHTMESIDYLLGDGPSGNWHEDDQRYRHAIVVRRAAAKVIDGMCDWIEARISDKARKSDDDDWNISDREDFGLTCFFFKDANLALEFRMTHA